MKKLLPFILSLLTCSAIAPAVASATIDSSVAITKLGVQNNYGYMMFSSGLTQSCSYQTVYVDISTDSGKALYATAMTAFLSGKTLSRVEYSISNGMCMGSLIEL